MSNIIGNAQTDLQEQRIYSPHGMPKRDPATHRKLMAILGHEPENDRFAPALTKLPADVLNEVGKVAQKNNELSAQIPSVLKENQQIKQEVGALRADMATIQNTLGQIVQALGLAKASASTLEQHAPDQPKAKKGRDLPPAEK